MKKILIAALLMIGGLSSKAHADACSTSLIPLFTAQQAAKICGKFGAGTVGTLANATYAVGRNVGDTANINVWQVSTADDTVINSSASDDLIFQLEDDADRLVTFDAGSDTALRMAFGDGDVATQIQLISALTADADDDLTIRITGGGAYATDGSRGAVIVIPGEEVSGGSDITYNAGASDTHIFQVAGTTAFTINGTGELIGAGTATLGWAIVAGANAACSTTCTTPCVFGVNTAATEADIVACSDATADECLCAGAT